MATTPQVKERITCHVLDVSLGKPAKSVRVKLELNPTTALDGGVPSASKVFESQTDDDGRIKVWLPYSSATSSGEVPVYTLEDVLENIKGPSLWTLRFDTASYYGDANTFFPEVVVTFRVEAGQHYHVPLLLSPYSYSTYRGS